MPRMKKETKMKIGIIGAGNVGAALGARWSSTGHEVMFGVRDLNGERVQSAIAAADGKPTAGSVAEAAAFGDLVVLATPFDGTEDAIGAAGDLSGKIVMDASNPLKADTPGLQIGFSESAGERVAAAASGARVVKAFNTTGSGNMADPAYSDGAPTMFICGDDEEAKSTIMGLAEEIGFDPVDAGGIQSSRFLEPLAMLWISLAYGLGNGPNIAFRLMRRDG
jgi:predicted dinucleotide-binding enzyme